MSYFVNNAIALIVHALIAAITTCFLKHISSPNFSWKISESILFLIMLFAVSLIYVICGFFLKHVEKFLFLSVVSVPIILVIALIYFMSMGGESGFNYFYTNPIAVSVLGIINIPDILNAILVFLSPTFPALLMYIGMVLRKVLWPHFV